MPPFGNVTDASRCPQERSGDFQASLFAPCVSFHKINGGLKAYGERPWAVQGGGPGRANPTRLLATGKKEVTTCVTGSHCLHCESVRTGGLVNTSNV